MNSAVLHIHKIELGAAGEAAPRCGTADPHWTGNVMWEHVGCRSCLAHGDKDIVREVQAAVADELFAARLNWPEFNSAHEGFGVLREEYKELDTHVLTNQKRRDLPAMRKEAIQLAAMAMRFAIEVCNEQVGRR